MIKFIYRILGYLFSILFSFLLAFIYMKIALGSKQEETTDLIRFLNWFYDIILFHIVPITGSIIASIYILLDIFYFHKRLKNASYSSGIRLLIITAIAIIVGISHYVLEKVFDII